MGTQSIIRREQTQHDTNYLAKEIADWVGRRRNSDARGQHHTQLSSLETTLGAALRRISELADNFAIVDVRDTFDYFRGLDHQVTSVRRVWRWFAEKYDQRDDPRIGPVLGAADEVVWSVHAEAHREASHGFDVPPAPLPYLDAVDTPEAVPREEPSRQLRPDKFDDMLVATLARLPIPVVALPATATAAPWQLILLGHEVGHHLLYDLMDKRALLPAVGSAVAEVVDPGQVGRFRAWSQEMFADLAGLAAFGPALISGLLPYELGADDHALDRERGRYPAPVVRLALLATLCRLLKFGAADSFADLKDADWIAERVDDPLANRRAAVRADMKLVPLVACALVKFDLLGLGTVVELLNPDPVAFRPGERVDRYADILLVGGGNVPEKGLRAVRELMSAGMIASLRLQNEADRAKRREAEEQLADRLVTALVASRESGKRAGAASAVEADGSLVSLLAGGL
jgi:hypothetical protein